MLLGVVGTAMPALAQAQNPTSTDPVPLARVDPGYSPAGPGYGAQPMGSATPMPVPMMPMAGYAPGMGGGMPAHSMAPKLDPKYKSHPPGLLHAIFANNAEDIDDDCWHWLLNGQYIHYTRARLKSHVFAARDNNVGFDDGLAARNAAPVGTFGDLRMDDEPAWRASVGLYRDGFVVELAGFQLPRSQSELTLQDQGRLTSFFFNPPLGFEGTNPQLWDNADIIRVNFSQSIYGFEANTRWIAIKDGAQLDCLLGIRYMDLSERLAVFTDDDSLQFAPDPLSEATYVTRARNHLLGLQAGLSMHQALCGPLAMSWDVKGAWCANMANIDVNLTRGDGFLGFNNGETKYSFAQVYEAGGYMELQGSFWRVRGGYQLMLATGIATAENQLDFNLLHTSGRPHVRGTTLYYGPTVSVEVFF
jgi:hypothetical protein